MKKIVSLLLTGALCIAAMGTFASCGENHKHTFETKWTSDETHHWHKCEDENCLEISGKAEHTWDEGKITLEATKNEAGIKTYTCTNCKKPKPSASNTSQPPKKHGKVLSIAPNCKTSHCKLKDWTTETKQGFIRFRWQMLTENVFFIHAVRI